VIETTLWPFDISLRNSFAAPTFMNLLGIIYPNFPLGFSSLSARSIKIKYLSNCLYALEYNCEYSLCSIGVIFLISSVFIYGGLPMIKSNFLSPKSKGLIVSYRCSSMSEGENRLFPKTIFSSNVGRTG